MKKIFLMVLAVAVLFCLPMTAQAKTEFELGGYIRLDALWTSSNTMAYSLGSFSPRSNVAGSNHGKFLMNANATRFNFTIKGPEVWGGKVTGFIEVDFDGQAVTQPANTVDSTFNQAKLRLRHAMFKINWPDREILFGQFWSVNSELIPETADSQAYALYGATQLRLPQVRFTYKFTDEFNASLAVCSPQNGRWGLNIDPNNPLEGETSETPMVEVKARYEQDLWGKAAWYGKPRAFYVGLGAGYFRSRNQAGLTARNASDGAGFVAAPNWFMLGQNNYFVPGSGVAAINQTMRVNNNNYHDHWLFLIENFTPIIPTVTKNLAGSLGLAHQWWVGQGVSAWRLDMPGSDRYYRFENLTPGVANSFDYSFTYIKRYGGWAQLQYYWTNEIYTNVNFGFEKAFGFQNGRDSSLAALIPTSGGSIYANPAGFDPIASVWRAGVTQWYRPVPAVKFALQYTFSRTNYFQTTSIVGANQIPTNDVNQTNTSRFGTNHAVMANAWYMF
jgi:hypothetical protein